MARTAAAIPSFTTFASIYAERETRLRGFPYCAGVDIVIMALLLAVALLVWRGANRGVVIGLWFVGVVAMLGLFDYHVTSALDLSF